MHIIIECPLAYVPGIDAGQTAGIGVKRLQIPQDTLSSTFNCGSRFVDVITALSLC